MTRLLKIYHPDNTVDDVPFVDCNSAQAFTARILKGCKFEYGFLDLNSNWTVLHTWNNVELNEGDRI